MPSFGLLRKASGNVVFMGLDRDTKSYAVMELTNVDTGAVTVVSDDFSGCGPNIRHGGLMASLRGDNLLIFDQRLRALYLIDPVTGGRQMLSRGHF